MNDSAQFDPIDARRALELLEKAVAERGEEYVYDRHVSAIGVTSCVYVADGMPSCMVGVALTLHGMSTAALTALNNCAAISLHEVLPDIITEGAAAVFDAAQTAQDERTSWGFALGQARAAAADARVSA